LPQKADAFGWEACIGIAQSRRVEACLIEERSDIEPPCLQRLHDSLDPEGSGAALITIHSCPRSDARHLQLRSGSRADGPLKCTASLKIQRDPQSHLIGRKSQ
jgi:hypothetical protein